MSRTVSMSLVHDLAEGIVGDITPHCGITDEDKYDRENKVCFVFPLQSFYSCHLVTHSAQSLGSPPFLHLISANKFAHLFYNFERARTFFFVHFLTCRYIVQGD